jgi:hypothetical protein
VLSVINFFGSASSVITDGANKACGGGASCNTGSSVAGIFAGVSNALIFLVGAVSVIMIIVGGLRYVLSNGDAKQTESAKNTILYAVIGVIVAVAAYAIVSFTVSHIK